MVRDVKMQGAVLEIHRMALDDGPGIRTAVFLKGCRLHCPWCHNPESQSAIPELMVRVDKCKECKKCIDICPVNNLNRMAEGFDWSKCISCFACAEVCGNGALRVAGKVMTAEEVMNTVVLDENHYRFTNGGITLTGGDPLCQVDFSCEILSLAKKRGIHTCVETSGVGQRNALKKLLPFTDLWLYDLKGNPDIYRRKIGIDFSIVEQGLIYLLEHKAEVILRCPIITDVTDSDEWIIELCGFIEKMNKIYPLQDVHLLPFHRLGLDKYRALGKISDMENAYPPGNEWMKKWNETVRQAINEGKDE